MLFSTIASTLALFATVAFADTASLDYNYNNADGSTNGVACSNGEHGLAAKYPTFGSFPSYPNIGGAAAVATWNSPNCGACFKLTYPETGKFIYFTAIDHTADGFNIAEYAFKDLVGSTQAGRVDVEAEEVDQSMCGL